MQLRKERYESLQLCAALGSFLLVYALATQPVFGQIVNDKDLMQLQLMIAANKGNLEGVKLSIEKGATINQIDDYGQTAIAKAAFNGHEEAVLWLLNNGADINLSNPAAVMGGTAFQSALTGNHLDLAKSILIESPTPFNAQGPGVGTPLITILDQIIMKGDRELLQTYIERATNIDPNIKGVGSLNALDSAIIQNDIPLAVMLLQIDGWQLTPDGMNETILFTAVRANSPELVAAILDNVSRIDLNQQNIIGQNVLDIAAENPDILRLFQDHKW